MSTFADVLGIYARRDLEVRLLAGGWMGLARFTRCRPGGTHGYDPVPDARPVEAQWYLPWRYGTWR
ncbi:hypothetical protein [Devosia rhodophyticola]|uniref:hypothetical protein n=1 Tax=Devosia rhodophyticola TaxID=3026423 RepID=UPI00389918E3